MRASTSHTRWLAALGVLLLIVILSACGVSPALTATPVATNTPTPIPASPTPEPTPDPIAELEVSIDSDTVWREVFDTLTTAEQACIRDALGDELESALGRPVMSESDAPEQWEVSLFSCLAPETARAVYLSVVITEMQDEVELSENELACLRELMAGTDVAAVVAAMVADADDRTAAAEFFSDFVSCLPDQLLSTMIAEMGLEWEELSADEVSCLRGLLADVDWGALLFADAGEDVEAYASFGIGMFSCIPALLLSGALGQEVELSETEASCLREAFAAIDINALLTAADDLAGFAALAPDLVGCVPDLFVSLFIAETGASLEDLSEEEWDCLRESIVAFDWEAVVAEDPTAVSAASSAFFSCIPGLLLSAAIGEDVELSEEEASCLREAFAAIDVTTLIASPDDPDAAVKSAVVLLNCAPRLIFAGLTEDGEALSEEEVSCLQELVAATDVAALIASPEDSAAYVEFGVGLLICVPDLFNTGDDTDTESVADIAEDHASAIEAATAVTVGEAMQGTLEHENDSDVFVFQAEEGVFYQIDVVLGTLSDSLLGVYDADEQELAYNDDHGDTLASRIIWKATSSGEYYVAVEGYDTGSYSLMVTVADITDDHASAVEGATAVAVGETVPGALDYTDDIDVFVFQAEEGVFYQIDVALGTLSDSLVYLYDADELLLTFNDDHSNSLASRIVWGAPRSGAYYVAVEGYGTGSYTLTVAVADVTDDRANAVEGATPTPTPLPTPGPEPTIVAERDVLVSFRLENGKQATVYREGEDTLVYTFGFPGNEPELEYRGPILAEVRAVATLWDEGVGSLAELARALAKEDSSWAPWDGERHVVAQKIAEAASGQESRGFVTADTLTGILSQSVYIFRVDGWEYSVVSTYERPINSSKHEYSEWHSVTAISPQGKKHTSY